MNEQTQRLLLALEMANIETFKQAWSTSCADGTGLLHEAVSCGRFVFIQFMLENGADPNSRAFSDRITPLMFGWLKPYADRLKAHLILLKYGANPYIIDTLNIRVSRTKYLASYMESYLVVELICGEADNLSLDLWRVIKPFIYNI